MFITVHSAIGIAAATALGTQNPIAAFSLGWLLHYVGDAIPHGDEQLGAWCMSRRRPTLTMGAVFAVDILVLMTVSAVVHLVYGLTPVMLAVVAGSAVPDLLLGAEMTLKRRRLCWLTHLHVFAHKSIGFVYPLKYGLPFQISLVVVMWMVVATGHLWT